MTNEECQRKLRNIFGDTVQIYSKCENRIELDVSTKIQISEWDSLMKDFRPYEQIPHSWKCGDITIVLFNGPLNRFIGKSVPRS